MPQVVSFNLLEFIEKWRQDNGFYHSNYQRYCKLCTSRLSTLRKELHFNTLFGINPKSKDINKPIYFRASDMENQSLESLLYETKLYEYILMQSERCISRGMQLRGFMQGGNVKSKRSIYRSLTSVQRNEQQRLGRAQERSETLIALATRTGDVTLRVSARAYNQYVKGLVCADLEDHFEAMKFFRMSQALIEHLVAKKLIIQNDVAMFVEVNAALMNHSHFMASSFAGGDAEIIQQLNKDLTAPAPDELTEPGALEAERAADLESHDEATSILIFIPHNNDNNLEGEVLKVKVPQVVTKTLRKLKEDQLTLLTLDHKQEIQIIRDERTRLSSIMQQNELFPAVPSVFSPPRKTRGEGKEQEANVRKAFKQLTHTLNIIKRLQQATKSALDRPQAQDSLALKQLNDRLDQARKRLQHEYNISIVSWFIFGLYGIAAGAPGAVKVQKAVCELSEYILGIPLVTPLILHGQAQKNDKAAYMSIIFNLATLATSNGRWMLKDVNSDVEQDKTQQLQKRNMQIIKNTLQLVKKLQGFELKPSEFSGCVLLDLAKLYPVLQAAQSLQSEKLGNETPALKLSGNPGLIPPPLPETIHIDCVAQEMQFDDIFEDLEGKIDESLVYNLKRSKNDVPSDSTINKAPAKQKEAPIIEEVTNAEAPAVAAPDEKKKKGLFGRLFGF